MDIAAATGAAVLVVCGVAYSITRERPPIVNIRWRAGIESTHRRELQQRHALRDCEPAGDRTDRCELLDTSRANLARIIADPEIEDTHRIQRATLTIAPDADKGRHMTWIAYRVPLLRQPRAIETVLLAAFALILCGFVPRRRAASRGEGHGLITLNVGLATIAVALFGVLVWTTGRIEVNDGLGYDGLRYAEMVQNGLSVGSPMNRMRPLVLVLAWIPYYFTQDVVRSFELLNYAFVFLEAYLIAKLGELYGLGRFAKAYLVVSLALCIATARMFAYYPILIDLGGYVAVTLAVYAVLVAPRPLAAIAVCLAVLTREFGIAAVLFGFHRDLRQGSGLRRAAVTYVPAIVLVVLLRRLAVTGVVAASISTIMLENIGRLQEPLFVAFLAYFLLTTFGGISLILFARPAQCARFLSEEPEWISFAVVILAMAMLWSFDFWRYLAFLLPVAVVLFARASADWTFREQMWLYLIAAFATWYTQRPFEHVDLRMYFRDWFPYYVAFLGSTPLRPEDLWPVWGWRFALAIALLSLLSLSNVWRRRRGQTGGEVALLPTI
jgi:hypothetical protein